MKQAWMMALAGAGALLATTAIAAENGGEAVGTQTREWMELQRSGKAAGASQRLSGAAESRVYARYLESFTHPIPEFFKEREEFIAESGSGGK